MIEKVILPSLIQQKKASKSNEIRIWSAACASGQEMYSLLILLNEYQFGSEAGVHCRAFATDSSAEQVDIARKGIFAKNALGNVTLQQLNTWFTKQGNNYAIKELLKEHIVFSVFDLLDNAYTCPPESIFGNFDIVFCANMLFYYKKETREYILNKVNNSLSDNGFLITSETERETLIQAGFIEVYPQSSIFRKNK